MPVNGSRKSLWAPASRGRLAGLAVSDRSRAWRNAILSPSTLARSSSHPSLVRRLPRGAVRDVSSAAFSAEAVALNCPAAMAALMASVANGAAVDLRSLRSCVLMKMTPNVSAGFPQTAWVAHGMRRRGALAIRRDDHADSRRRTERVKSTRSTRGRRIPRYACLVRRTGRIAAGESGAGIAPEPIDTRKKKESRAVMDRTLSARKCPTLSAFYRGADSAEPAQLLRRGGSCSRPILCALTLTLTTEVHGKHSRQ